MFGRYEWSIHFNRKFNWNDLIELQEVYGKYVHGWSGSNEKQEYVIATGRPDVFKYVTLEDVQKRMPDVVKIVQTNPKLHVYLIKFTILLVILYYILWLFDCTE